MKQHVISILAEDHPGVLSRISGLIARRGYNMESLSVGHTHKKGISRFTIVVNGDDRVLKQIVSQLSKLIETLQVNDLSSKPFVERWLMLVKVKASLETRPHVLQIAEIFRSRVVDIGDNAIILEVTGDRGKIKAFLEAVKSFGILEVSSSGAVAMGRSGFENGKNKNSK